MQLVISENVDLLSAYFLSRFDRKEYLFEISEGARVGTYLGTLSPISHLGVMFSLQQTANQVPFIVNPSSGVLTLDKPLDYEKTVSYNISVLAVSMVSVPR